MNSRTFTPHELEAIVHGVWVPARGSFEPEVLARLVSTVCGVLDGDETCVTAAEAQAIRRQAERVGPSPRQEVAPAASDRPNGEGPRPQHRPEETPAIGDRKGPFQEIAVLGSLHLPNNAELRLRRISFRGAAEVVDLRCFSAQGRASQRGVFLLPERVAELIALLERARPKP